MRAKKTRLRTAQASSIIIIKAEIEDKIFYLHFDTRPIVFSLEDSVYVHASVIGRMFKLSGADAPQELLSEPDGLGEFYACKLLKYKTEAEVRKMLQDEAAAGNVYYLNSKGTMYDAKELVMGYFEV